MKALVVYDSQYGNTQKIAEAIGRALTAAAKRTDEVQESDLNGIELLVVGSPTQGGRPTAGIMQFVNGLRADRLKGVRVAAFDTRLAKEEQGFFVRALMSVIGYAAGKIAANMVKKGGIRAANPEGFIVQEKEGPLREGEMRRAEAWAGKLSQSGSSW